MERYSTWIRLHPVAHDPSLRIAVQARIADPLWMLGRQWQLGELRHDGGATPVDVQLDGTISPITALRAPDGATIPVGADGEVLEAVVEALPVREDGLEELELRTRAGLHFLRVMRAAGLETAAAAWRDRCSFPTMVPGTPPAAGDRLARVAGRVADGARLAGVIRAGLAMPGMIEAREAEVLRGWLAWYDARFVTPAGGVWDPERLEYRFSAAAPAAGGGEVTLTAPEHADGRLDWFTFDGGGEPLGAAGVAEARRTFRIPAPLDFAGKPNPRFWTFEDASQQLDGLLGDPTRPIAPAAAMVLDFVMSYADDWFLIPVPIDGWAVYRVGALQVRDAFGDVTAAQVPAGRWNLFRLDDPSAPSGLADGLLHAVAAAPVEGDPLEEVHLLRDEVANVVWAVERIVPNALGAGARQDTSAPPVAPAAGAEARWTLAPAALPAGWFPLVPQAPGRLTLGALWSARSAAPRGQVLKALAAPGRVLHQEEVPPSGIRVTRRWQAARDRTGGLHLWVGAAKGPHRSEVEPALRFDLVEPGS